MKQQSWVVFSIIFAVIIAIFAVINVETVKVDFLFTTTDAPLILVILLSVLMGALLIVGFSFSKIYQLKREVKLLKRNEKQVQDERPQTTNNSNTSAEIKLGEDEKDNINEENNDIDKK